MDNTNLIVSLIASFIPFLLVGSILGFISMSIAKRKGRSRALWFIAGLLLPAWPFFVVWLASLPDKAILDQFKTLSDEIQKLKSDLKEK